MGNADDASKLNPSLRQNFKKMKDKKLGGSARKEKVSIFKKCGDVVDRVLQYK